MRTAHSLLRLVSILLDLAQGALQFLLLGTRSSAALKAENIFLRKQLALYLEREAKPRRATDATRLSMVLLSRLFAWQSALINVKPETFLGWHRKAFQLLWRWQIEASRQATTARRGTEIDPENGSGESDVGRGADCRGIAPQTTHSRLASDGPTLHASRHWTEETRSFSTLDDVRTNDLSVS